ncbi:MAG: PorV/PorQ family protein [Rhizobacter sp.]|nr:PorV/PorQ family protein [Chlorobiales bacterium]
MTKRIISAFITFVSLWSAGAVLNQEAAAQSKTGTTVGQFLLIEPSARLAAMGNAGVATYAETMSSFYNPAAAGMLTGYNAQFTHSQWLADISYNYATVAIAPGRWGTLFFNFTSLSSGDIAVRTVDAEEGTGEFYSVTDIAIGVGYSRQFTDKFSAGVHVNYFQETIWNSSLNSVTFSVGAIYRLSPGGLHIGASISNFGTRAKYSGRDLKFQYDSDPNTNGGNGSLPAELSVDEFDMPTIFRVGLSLPVNLTNDQKATFVIDAFHPGDNTESLSLGAEWTFRNLLSVRGGYQNLFQQDSETGLSLGAGLQYTLSSDDVVRFDYAWTNYNRLIATHRFTLGVSF